MNEYDLSHLVSYFEMHSLQPAASTGIIVILLVLLTIKMLHLKKLEIVRQQRAILAFPLVL